MVICKYEKPNACAEVRAIFNVREPRKFRQISRMQAYEDVTSVAGSGDTIYFLISYNTEVGFIYTYLDEDLTLHAMRYISKEHYSRTTQKHITRWLRTMAYRLGANDAAFGDALTRAKYDGYLVEVICG